MSKTSPKATNSQSNFYKKTFLLLLILFIITVIYLYAFIFLPKTEIEIEKNKDNYENTLLGVETILDNTFLSIHDIQTKTTQEKAVLESVVTNHSFNESDILLSLSSMKSTSILIDECFLYIPNQEKVYASNYHSYPLSSFYLSEFIKNYYTNNDFANEVRRNGRKTNIVTNYNNLLILARDFPLENDNRLGSLFVVVDKTRLENQLKISSLLDEKSCLYILDGNNLPVLSHSYLTDETFNSSHPINLQEVNRSYNRNTDHLTIFKTSALSNFRFLLIVEDFYQENFLIYFLYTLPLVGIWIIIIIYMYNMILKPLSSLSQLTKSFEREKEENRQVEANDFSWNSNPIANISSSLYSALHSISHLEDFILQFQPTISSEILKNLLEGNLVDDDFLDKNLQTLNVNFDLDSFYNVILLVPDKSVSYDMHHFLLAKVRDHLSSQEKFHFYLESNFIDKSENAFYSVILMEFKQETPNRIEITVNFAEKILNLISASQVNYQVSIGLVSTSIKNINYSYQIAKNNIGKSLQETQEDLNLQEQILPISEDNSEDIFSRNYIYQFSKKLIQYWKTRQDGEAQSYWQYYLNDTLDQATSLQIFKNTLLVLLEEIENVLNGISNIRKKDKEILRENLDPRQIYAKEDFEDQFKRLMELTEELIDESIKKMNHPYLVRAIAYITKHFQDNNLSLSLVADFVETNPSYLSRLFRENYGQNYSSYVNHLRVDYAQDLLLTTDLLIEDIANEVGFASSQNFTKVFKEVTGITPGQYRQTKSKN